MSADLKKVKCLCCGTKVLETFPCRVCGVRTVSNKTFNKIVEAAKK
jgi:hypothetical protein